MVMMFLLVLLPLLAVMMAGLRWVPEDTVLTVHRFGRYVRTLTPGLRFTLPLVDQVAHRVRLVGHQLEVPLAGEDAARADVYYQILEPKRTGNALENVDAVVQRHVVQALSQLGGAENADHGPRLAVHLRELNQDLSEFGLRVTRCQVHPGTSA